MHTKHSICLRLVWVWSGFELKQTQRKPEPNPMRLGKAVLAPWREVLSNQKCKI